MAFTMSGEVQLNATKETVYAKLNDPAVLKACIPGCEELDMVSPTEFVAVSVIKIGPVKAKMKGKVKLSDLDPPTVTRSRAKARAASPALPRAAPALRCPTRTAVLRSNTMLTPRSAANWPSLASGLSPVRRRNWRTIFSPSSPHNVAAG